MTQKLTLYHGTSIGNAKSIKSSFFRVMGGRCLSFGEGAYFYQDIEKARRFARAEYNADACVLEVEILPKKVKSFSRYELQNYPSYFNEVALREDLDIIDASEDDGIIVVRPKALQLISPVKCHF